jgi:hypothetical protein
VYRNVKLLLILVKFSYGERKDVIKWKTVNVDILKIKIQTKRKITY